MRRPLVAFLAVAVVGLAATAAVITSRGSGSDASSCAETWSSTVSGSPALVQNGIYLWRGRGDWHVSLRHVPASLVGRISSDGGLRVGAVSSALQSALSAKSRAVRFHSPSSRNGSLVFHARCASRLAFSFAAPAKPRVFLGRANRPVSPQFVLDTAKTTGVSGQIYTSGGCPVVRIGQRCPSAKALHRATSIQVVTAPTSKTSPPGQPVKTITSASDGSYSTTLPPGRYLLRSVGQGGPGSGFTPVEVTVAPGVVAVVDLAVDSGIR